MRSTVQHCNHAKSKTRQSKTQHIKLNISKAQEPYTNVPLPRELRLLPNLGTKLEKEKPTTARFRHSQSTLFYGTCNTDHVLSEDHAPSKASVQGSPVEHDGVFNVVAGVRHNGNRCILTPRYLKPRVIARDMSHKLQLETKCCTFTFRTVHWLVELLVGCLPSKDDFYSSISNL